MAREIPTLKAAGQAARIDWPKVEHQLPAKLEDWKQLLRRHVPQARQVLKRLLAGPIVFTPHREDGSRYYAFTAPINLGRLLTGMVCANMVASPGIPSWNQMHAFLQEMRRLRESGISAA